MEVVKEPKTKRVFGGVIEDSPDPKRKQVTESKPPIGRSRSDPYHQKRKRDEDEVQFVTAKRPKKEREVKVQRGEKRKREEEMDERPKQKRKNNGRSLTPEPKRRPTRQNSVAKLLEMGYPKEAAVNALQVSGGSVEEAINLLVNDLL